MTVDWVKVINTWPLALNIHNIEETDMLLPIDRVAQVMEYTVVH